MGESPPSPRLQSQNVDFEIEPNTRNPGVFSLYFADNTFSFEWIPNPSRDRQDLLAHNIPPKVTVSLSQIAQIHRSDRPINTQFATILRFQLSDGTSLPRFVFNVFPDLFVSHLLEFLSHKRAILQSSARTFRVLPASADAVVATVDDPTLPPQQIVEIAEHNRILQSLNFRADSKPPGAPLKSILKTQDFSALKREIFLCGLDPSARPHVWPILFGALPFSHDPAVISAHFQRITGEYLRIQERWSLLTGDQLTSSDALQELQHAIAADARRNDRRQEAFAGDDNPNLNVLRRVLTAYALFNRDAGYVQGMNDLVSQLIVLYIQRWENGTAILFDGTRRTADEAEAFVFWNFVGMMELTQHGRLFTDLAVHQEFVLDRARAIATAVHPPLKKLLKATELTSVPFLFRPMILMYKRAFKRDEVQRVWDAIFTSEAPACFTRFISAAILILLFPKLLLHTNRTLGDVMVLADGFLLEVDSRSVLALAACLAAAIGKGHPEYDFVYEPVPDRPLYRKYVPQFMRLN
jgi:hypothetical protein